MHTSANDNRGPGDWAPHIVDQPPGALKRAARPVRTHSERQITQIMGSIH